MAIELNEFWSRLVQAGVLDARRCKLLTQQYQEASGGNSPSQADEIARFLVKKKVITPFQSDAFLAPQPVELRLGPYLIRDPKTAAPFGRFAQAVRTTDGAIGILLRAGIENPWLEKHAAIDAPNLQPLAADIIGDYQAVFSAIGEGKVLSRRLSDQAWSTQSVVSLGIKLASALSVMHDADIVHGAVRADRVWIRDDGEAILLREPSGPALAMSQASLANDWLETIDDPSLYIAPELLLSPGNDSGKSSANSGNTDQSIPTRSSDLYSLGCLLFRLASGRYPVVGRTTEQTLGLHATEIPIELSTAIEQGEKGAPLYRVLAYAMAKSPEARFADASQLATALKAVGTEVGRNKRSEVPATAAQATSRSPEATASKEKRKEKKQASTKSGNVEPENPQPTVPPQPMMRSRRKRKSRAPWVLGGLAGVVVLQIIALSLMDPTQPVVRRRAEFVPPAVIPRVSNRAVRESVVSDATKPKQASSSTIESDEYQLVQDQRLLYAPPSQTAANPITLDLLPPGPAMVVSVRLADLQKSTFGQSMLDAFSPDLQSIIDSMVKRMGVSADTVSRATAAFYSGRGSDPIEVAVSVTLEQPQPMQSLLKVWDVSAARTREGQTIYVGDEPNSDAYYLPLDQAKEKLIDRFAVGSIDSISELASIDGEPIPLPRSLKSLWDATDQDTDVCVLVSSNFLFADGRSLLQQSMPQAIDPLRRLLVSHTSAFLLVADSPTQSSDTQQVYSEIRFSALGGITGASLARLVGDRIEQWPEWADQFSAAARPDKSWQPLARRLPAMVKFVANRIRVGVDDRTAVANVYLPAIAVPQISLGTVLAMNTPVGGIADADKVDGELLTVDQILDRPMSVSFGQESLEFAIDAIKDSLGQQLPSGNKVPTIQIIGGDLQLMGITQNQQIRDFAKQDLPLRQVLTDLVVAANPDKSATGPADEKQSLIWVVTGASDDRQILVTTRQAAQTKEYALPPEFQP